MNKIVSKDSFLAPFLEKQTIDETDPKLKERFIEIYRPRLEKLWQEFLTDCAVEKTAEKYPLLLKKIEDTPHSIPELRMIPSLGEKTVKEIEAYMKEVLRS